MDETQKRVTRCFSAVFPNLSQDEIFQASTTNVKAWDSVAGVTLFAMIEEEYAELNGYERARGYDFVRANPRVFAEDKRWQGLADLEARHKNWNQLAGLRGNSHRRIIYTNLRRQAARNVRGSLLSFGAVEPEGAICTAVGRDSASHCADFLERKREVATGRAFVGNYFRRRL